MRKLLTILSVVVLAGCGEKNTATAPVDNIKDDIQTGEDLKKTVKDIGQANKDTVDKMSKDNLKMK